jgi:hypothetical protein
VGKDGQRWAKNSLNIIEQRRLMESLLILVEHVKEINQTNNSNTLSQLNQSQQT